MECVTWAPGTTLANIEREIIVNCFAFYRGNKSATAQSLGITVRTLENKIAGYEADNKAAEERKLRIAQERDEWARRQRGQLEPLPQPVAAPVVAETPPSGELETMELDPDIDDLIGGDEPETPTPIKAPTPAMPPTPQRQQVAGRNGRR